MDYTITMNPQFNSVEVFFDGKPSEAVRDALKALRFRWHGVKKCWYGYKTEEEIRAAIEGKPAADTKPAPKAKPATANKYGVKVGDIFYTTWGYEQTNNDFFQVVALAGAESVRVRQVDLPRISSDAVSWASEDITYSVNRGELLPASASSVFIKDQKNGDLKKLKSYAADGVSDPQFRLASFASAWKVKGDTIKVYESWYA